MSLEHRFLKLIENAPVIEEEWAKAMDVAVMQELKKFGQQVGKIIGTLLEVVHDATHSGGQIKGFI